MAPNDIRPWTPAPRGSRVAVVAPSSPVRPEMLAAGLAELDRLGWAANPRDDIIGRDRFTAGPVARRRVELQDALTDGSVRAVWVARGGYGLTPLLGDLVGSTLVADPKPVVGESDATALGCWALAQGVGWVHGPMVAATLRLGAGRGYDEPSLRACLEGWAGTLRLEAAGARTLASGVAEGVPWGGCLSILAALAGTPHLPRIPGGLLVVEDVGVKPYQVHRMLVQLRDAGALEELAGVLLGDFSSCVQHPEQGYDMDEVLVDFFHETAPGCPVSSGWPIGHAASAHLTIPLGLPARLACSAGGSPVLEVHPVAWPGGGS